jgi:hypothetical protein
MFLFGGISSNPDNSVYDFRQQWAEPPGPGAPMSAGYPGVVYLRKALGDDNFNDRIDGAEVAKEMPPFLLISRGPLRT